VKNISNDIHYDANDPAEQSYKAIEKMLPKDFDINDAEQKQAFYEDILRKTKDPIVLYLHGNTGTRANGHRIELYRILQRLGNHVIAMDYRGFADSSDISPTEIGCVNDAFAMYRYIKNITNNPIFVYGHSLGKVSVFDVY
jgi:abhydrolase domain-containing protein 12